MVLGSDARFYVYRKDLRDSMTERTHQQCPLRKIPATVITGFLGAGKTTLLRHLIEHAGGRRLGIMINEFGSVGVDTELLKGCGIPACEEADIVELANGCLCCTVADEFLPAMEALLDRPDPPVHIVIETSGLALPKPLLKAFGWPSIRSRVTVDGVIAVVDGPAVATGRFADDPQAVARQREADPQLDHDNPLAEVYEDQLQCADLSDPQQGRTYLKAENPELSSRERDRPHLCRSECRTIVNDKRAASIRRSCSACMPPPKNNGIPPVAPRCRGRRARA